MCIECTLFANNIYIVDFSRYTMSMVGSLAMMNKYKLKSTCPIHNTDNRLPIIVKYLTNFDLFAAQRIFCPLRWVLCSSENLIN